MQWLAIIILCGSHMLYATEKCDWSMMRRVIQPKSHFYKCDSHIFHTSSTHFSHCITHIAEVWFEVWKSVILEWFTLLVKNHVWLHLVITRDHTFIFAWESFISNLALSKYSFFIFLCSQILGKPCYSKIWMEIKVT